MAEQLIPYTKQPVAHQELLSHWIAQGLIVSDQEAALHYLQFIGYYRLRGYARYFQHHRPGIDFHRFKTGTSFDQVLDLYKFDRKLRTNLTDALEKIEVSIRSVISETACLASGAHWFNNADTFKTPHDFARTQKTLTEILDDNEAKKKHGFLSHYYEKYGQPPFPPSWMLFEILSFGNVSHIYTALSSKLKKNVATVFDLSPQTLASWIRALSYLRNLCAHHCRVWNRIFTIKPEQDKRLNPYYIRDNTRFYVLAAIIHYFLRRIKGAAGWSTSIRELVSVRPPELAGHMGFPSTWSTLSAWHPAASTDPRNALL